MGDTVTTNPMMEAVQQHLVADDDADLWNVALETLVSEINLFAPVEKLPAKQFIRIGRCSHWFRPHQSRWTAAGGFAWPSGWKNTSGNGFSKNGLS